MRVTSLSDLHFGEHLLSKRPEVHIVFTISTPHEHRFYPDFPTVVYRLRVPKVTIRKAYPPQLADGMTLAYSDTAKSNVESDNLSTGRRQAVESLKLVESPSNIISVTSSDECWNTLGKRV